jgi:ectoine hydroxylase-related dioxygenase (phytanoyl-CoA dioxygenase family)
MGVESVSLYMSSYFRKAPGDHPSQWHKDIDAAPFVTKNFATMWISMSDLSENSGGLTYGLASHKDKCTFWDCDLPCETVDRRLPCTTICLVVFWLCSWRFKHD